MMQEIYDNNKGYIQIVLLLIISILSLWIFSPHASAIQLAQGDIVYKNETVDVSLALAWPDFAVAYCKGGYYGCTPPDQVIRIEGNMHKYWFNPAVWNYGTYYRWDGEWHRGENSVAFTVNPGTRPVVHTDSKNNSVSNETITTELSASRRTADDLRSFIITRGDDFTLTTHYPSKHDDTGTMWFFEFHDVILDIPLVKNGTDYSHYFSSSETGKMEIGDYEGFMQFSGPNGLQDIYYDAKEDNLDTPYDDSIIPDVSLEISSPEQTKKKYLKLTESLRYNDDIRVPVSLSIVEPSILVTEVVRDEEKKMFWVHGETTWVEGTPITVKLDPDNYALRNDIASHTWTTTAMGNLSVMREFDITIPYDESELALGKHEIKVSINKNHLVSETYHNFDVTDTFVIPTPTPAIKKVLSIPTMVTVTKTIVAPITTAPQSPVEPVVISTGGSYVVVEEKTITPSHEDVTALPTPFVSNITTQKPTPTPTKDPNIHVPLPWWIVVAAVGIAVWRKK